jgi:hypothetical protein
MVSKPRWLSISLRAGRGDAQLCACDGSLETYGASTISARIILARDECAPPGGNVARLSWESEGAARSWEGGAEVRPVARGSSLGLFLGPLCDIDGRLPGWPVQDRWPELAGLGRSLAGPGTGPLSVKRGGAQLFSEFLDVGNGRSPKGAREYRQCRIFWSRAKRGAIFDFRQLSVGEAPRISNLSMC